MKRSFILLAISVLFLKANAQNIPSDVTALVTVDVGALNKKLDTRFTLKLDTAYDQLTKVETILLNAIKSPKQMGIDKSKRVIVYDHSTNGEGSFHDKVIILPMANVKLFETVVISRLESSSQMTRSQRDGHKYFNYSHTNVIYNDDVAIFQRSDNYSAVDSRLYNSQYYFEYNEVIEYINRERLGENSGDLGGNDGKVKEQLSIIGTKSKHLEPSIGSDDAPDAVEETVMMEEAVDAVDAVADEAVEGEEVDEVTVEAAYSLRDKVPGYDYDNHKLMLAFQKEWIRKNRERIVRQNLEYEIANFNRNKNRLGTSSNLNESHKAALNSSHDVTVYFSALSANHLLGGLLGYSYTRMINKSSNEEIAEFLEGNYTLGHLDFDGRKIKIETVNHLNKNIQKYNSLVDKPVNQKFQYYLPKEASLYYSAYVSPEKIFESYIGLSQLSLRGQNYYQQQAMLGLDLFELFVDKDMMLRTFRGDFLYALAGYRTKINERTRTRYNDDTYKREEYIQKDTQVIPEMIFLGTIENKENLQAVLDVFEKRGFLQKKSDGVYQVIKYGYQGTITMTDYYIATKEDVFIVTNHQKLATQYISSGLPKGLRMDLYDMADLTKPGTHFKVSSEFFDSKLSSKQTRFMRRNDPFEKLGVDFVEMKEAFKEIRMESLSNSENEVISTATIELKDDVNILKELIQSSK
jgi:hypothetical protein